MKKHFAAALFTLGAVAVAAPARADAVDKLKAFVRDVQSGRADFTQTVTSPDGARKKVSNGSFEFARPNRFRFAYQKPFEQTIVADGQKVWIHDPDLNQVSSRKLSAALGTTPAALLAGAALDADFDLTALPSKEGVDWARAAPKQKDDTVQSLAVGFRGAALAAIEIVDGFGQRSLLSFSRWEASAPVRPDAFRFVVPKGADLLEQ